MAIFLGYMFLCTRFKDLHRVFEYHGAEHKTIACYEAGLPLTVENIRKQSRFHPRCGTSFMILVIIISIFLYAVLPWTSTALRVVYKLCMFPILVGISYEILKWAGRSHSTLAKLVSQPGLWMQRLTTFEPDDSMIEVAIAAVTPRTARKSGGCPLVNTAYQNLCARLMMAGVPDARFDAAQLYQFATGRDPRLDDGPTPPRPRAWPFWPSAAPPASRCSICWASGTLWTLRSRWAAACSAPRADSEVVCETAIELLQEVPAPTVYDLCAGTGCLGIGIAKASARGQGDLRGKSADAWPYLTANVSGTKRAGGAE